MNDESNEKSTVVLPLLSASKISTFKLCSWLYDQKYNKKLPDRGNFGSDRGTVSHVLLEVLLSRPEYVAKILAAKDIYAVPSVERLMRKTAKRNGIYDDYHLNLMKSFVYVGLKFDFFLEGYILLPPEESFEIKSDNPRFSVRGFVDKSGISPDGKSMIIVDYKSSKRKYTEKETTWGGKVQKADMDNNIQSMVYAYAAFKKYPELERVKCRFVFLKFVQKPFVEIEYDRSIVEGLELYLEYVSNKMINFTEEDAKSNLLPSEMIYKSGQAPIFGSYLCGLDEEGTMDGNNHPKFICAFKNPFQIYIWQDEKGKQQKTRELPPKGTSYETEFYKGCVKYYSENYQ